MFPGYYTYTPSRLRKAERNFLEQGKTSHFSKNFQLKMRQIRQKNPDKVNKTSGSKFRMFTVNFSEVSIEWES